MEVRPIEHYSESQKVGSLSEALAKQCGIDLAQSKLIRTAASLHDIGKLWIPESLLFKDGKLTPEEFELVKMHTIYGAEILKSVQGDIGAMARLCCLYHHEWYDGGGYWGRRIGELPDYVSFVAISDVFTALVSERTYKRAWGMEDAARYIQMKAGTQFDPELAGAFLALVQNGGNKSIQEVRR